MSQIAPSRQFAAAQPVGCFRSEATSKADIDLPHQGKRFWRPTAQWLSIAKSRNK